MVVQWVGSAAGAPEFSDSVTLFDPLIMLGASLAVAAALCRGHWSLRLLTQLWWIGLYILSACLTMS